MQILSIGTVMIQDPGLDELIVHVPLSDYRWTPKRRKLPETEPGALSPD